MTLSLHALRTYTPKYEKTPRKLIDANILGYVSQSEYVTSLGPRSISCLMSAIVCVGDTWLCAGSDAVVHGCAYAYFIESCGCILYAGAAAYGK